VLVVCVAVVAFGRKEEKSEKAMDPAAQLKASVMRGKALFDDPELGTTGQTCNSCHKAGGTKPSTMGDMNIGAFENLAHKYPRYWGMGKKVMALDQVVNWCIMTPLKGEPLAWDDQRLADLVAYCASVEPMMEEKEEE
jgi:cytochrome c